jgi:hypothetical protein
MLNSKSPRRIGILAIVVMLALSNVISAYAAPTNDNFADAAPISSVPFSINADTIGATSEADESNPCGSGYNPSSVWFSYTPPTNITLTARVIYNNFPTVLAVYTGSSLATLVQVGCSQYYYDTTFQAQAGTTYYFQVSGYYDVYQGAIPFMLDVTPPPQVNINYYPGDPSIFDNISFSGSAYDPVGIFGNTYAWTLSDGFTFDQSSFNHQFAADGDYQVSLTFTTYDGRSNTANTTVQVRTRDVAINKFSIPQTARVNTTKTISVDVTNKRYSDNVQVVLYKGLPGGGEQQIGVLTIYVPVRATRPTTFKFSYTFTSSDATVGKVTFRAIATLANGRDALPADNTAIGTTLVSK